MPLILDPYRSASSGQTAFFIDNGKQLTLHATGLAGTDEVLVEILELSAAPPRQKDSCCYTLHADIKVIHRTPLLCPDGTVARLTATRPVGVLNGPQGIPLGVRVVAAPAAVIHVYAHETDAPASCGFCICDVAPAAATPPPPPPAPVVYCASVPLSCSGEPGYGYHATDSRDPAATVLMEPCPGDTFTDAVYVYPSAGPGHTVRLVECDGTLIGYGVNRSDCAPDNCGCTQT